jgi:hypothetical protein
MGTPAYAKVSISINDSDEAVKKIEKWVKKANNGKLNGDFFITLEDIDPNYINAKISSERAQNLEWQDEKFCEFCQTIPEVEEYSSSVWIQGEGQWYSRD